MPNKSKLAWERRFPLVLWALIDAVAAGITARVLGQGFLFSCLVFLALQLLDRERRSPLRTGKRGFAILYRSTVSPEREAPDGASNLRVLIPRKERPDGATPALSAPRRWPARSR